MRRSPVKKRRPTPALADYARKRDFSRTAEPAPKATRAHPARRSELAFVIQKHLASRLHFDFRLELDGVMKSWAVPKGPTLDPAVKRLAVQVEDHPIEYNTFEGNIPKGEYGGGQVMIWDQGTYESDEGGVDALREGMRTGKLKFTLHGKRLGGSWALVRLEKGDGRSWLLMKHRDRWADRLANIVEHERTSAVSGRTMEEIQQGKKVWHSDRAKAPDPAQPAANPPVHAETPAARAALALTPMLAAVGTAIPTDPGWVFEPKYDGIRVLAYVNGDAVSLTTRNGIDRAAQFPEVVGALRSVAARNGTPFVADGEVVARDGKNLGRFQALQGRYHETGTDAIASHARERPAALIAFDLLLIGPTSLVHDPWIDRRAALQRLLGPVRSPALQLSHVSRNGQKLLAEARHLGWEGIMAKRADAAYALGRRSHDWLKLKIEGRQEFVVAGWTEPRRSRTHLGALLLGYYDAKDRLVYAGHTGTGFSHAALADMYRRLTKLERKTSPFDEEPVTNEPAHWTRPEVVVEVKFNEWTNDGHLRQPAFVGVRDDKNPKDVKRERMSVQKPVASPKRGVSRRSGLVDRIAVLQAEGGGGTLVVEKDVSLDVSNLDKKYFPKAGKTKGDVLRYYATVAPALLPLIADRPLILRRYPDGIGGEAFFQQKAPDTVPDGIRVEAVASATGEPLKRFVGGDLATLLYGAQLGALDVNPWHSRVGSLEYADYAILDLDPGEKVSFARVVQTAGLVQAALDEAGLHGALKTSGATGLHVYIPLPDRTSYDTSLLVAQIIATKIAEAHPREATVERAVKARPAGTVYVDYLQNIEGKSVAAAFSVRAREPAMVSAPLEWAELKGDLDPREFTIDTVPAQLAARQRIWTRHMSRPNRIEKLITSG